MSNANRRLARPGEDTAGVAAWVGGGNGAGDGAHVPAPAAATTAAAAAAQAAGGLPAECGCRLSAVRRDLDLALRVVAEAQMRLPTDAELVGASLSQAEAERLDRYCLNLKVSLDELRRWSQLLTQSATAVAARTKGSPQ